MLLLRLTALAFGIGTCWALGGCTGDDVCDPDAPNTICTIAGSGEQGGTVDDGPALEAPLYVPIDIAVTDKAVFAKNTFELTTVYVID